RAEYADFLQAQGLREQAEKAYRGALSEQPSLSAGWFNLGTLLAEGGRLDESSKAFQEAVDLDPSLAQALSPLIQVRTKGNLVTAVKSMGSPLASLPVRARGPGAVQLTIGPEASLPALFFLNVPAQGLVQISRPDGTLIRELPRAGGSTLRWDLLTGAGTPVGGGLYRASVQGRDPSGRPRAPQLLYIGVVRQRAE